MVEVQEPAFFARLAGPIVACLVPEAEIEEIYIRLCVAWL